jgi:hypothetical protein
LETQQHRAVERAEKPGDALDVEDVDELVGGAVRPLGTEGLIGELRERRLVVRRVDHAIQLGLLTALLRCLQLASAAAEDTRQVHCLLDFKGSSRHTIGTVIREQLLDS